MGWCTDDVSEKNTADDVSEKKTADNVSEKNTAKNEYKIKVEELKKDYKELKNEFDELKLAYEEVNKKMCDQSMYKHLKKEINKLKEDYKHCMEAVQKETFARTKAETEAKVLKDTLEAQSERMETPMDIDERMEDNCDAELNVDDAVNELIVDDERDWINPSKKAKQKKKNNASSNLKQDPYECNQCDRKFKEKNKLTEHAQTHIQLNRKQEPHGCDVCDKTFIEKSNLTEHAQIHIQVNGKQEPHDCDQCDRTFKEKKVLTEHKQTHIQVKNTFDKLFECDKCTNTFLLQAEFTEHTQTHAQVKNSCVRKCTKCEKIYSDMSKLRRHDWRSHREIECNICGDKLESRHEISSHRQSKHQMFRKAICKFFPDCLDGDECFFEHKQVEHSEDEHASNRSVCPNRQNCSDQSCQFSESEHGEAMQILCRFQGNCNRQYCLYKHTVNRRAFLGVSPLKTNRK